MGYAVSKLISSLVRCAEKYDDYNGSLMGEYFDKIVIGDDYTVIIYFCDGSVMKINEYGMIISSSDND